MRVQLALMAICNLTVVAVGCAGRATTDDQALTEVRDAKVRIEGSKVLVSGVGEHGAVSVWVDDLEVEGEDGSIATFSAFTAREKMRSILLPTTCIDCYCGGYCSSDGTCRSSCSCTSHPC